MGRTLTRLQATALVSMIGKRDVAAAQLGHWLFNRPKCHAAAGAILNTLFDRGYLRCGFEESAQGHRYVYELNESGENAARILKGENK